VSDHTPIPVAAIVVIGIVGGIGSGKSSVARWVATRHPEVLLINGDEAGHEILTLKSAQDSIREQFGNLVFDAAGQIDRRVLGQIVFGSGDKQQAARRELERIVHPRIREIFEKRIAAAAAIEKRAVLLDAAVLFEAGWNDLCDAVVFIDVPRSERLARLRAGRGWDEQEVERRESSQISLESKRTQCQFVIANAHAIDDAGRQLEELLVRIQRDRNHAQASSDPSHS